MVFSLKHGVLEARIESFSLPFAWKHGSWRTFPKSEVYMHLTLAGGGGGPRICRFQAKLRFFWGSRSGYGGAMGDLRKMPYNTGQLITHCGAGRGNDQHTLLDSHTYSESRY